MRKLVERTSGESFGAIGEPTGFMVKGKELKVGDFIAVVHRHYKTIDSYLVIKNVKNGFYTLMGWYSNPLDRLLADNYTDVKVIVNNENITEGILESRYGDYFSIVEPKKMTLEEIEAELGYPVELVEEV